MIELDLTRKEAISLSIKKWEAVLKYDKVSAEKILSLLKEVK